MRSWCPPAYSGTFFRCRGQGSASSILMVATMWWLMIWRSSAVSVPERMLRFFSSSSLKNLASCPERSVQRYSAMRRTRSMFSSRMRAVPCQDLETRVDEVYPVEDAFELRRLVHHVHRRGHLAAVVQQARDLELVAVLFRHLQIAQRPLAGPADRLGQHHGERRHALAVPARIGRFFVDRRVDERDEGLEQLLELGGEHAVGEGDRRLRGERFGHPLVGGE